MNEESAGKPRSGDLNNMEPADIYGQEFKRVLWGGYATGEVDEFLARVSETVDALTTQVRQLEDRNQEQRQQLDGFREMEETLRNALVTSQKFSENIIDSAKREAQTLIDEARLLRERAEFEAAKLPEALAEEVKELRDQRARLLAEMHAVIETHGNLLDCLVRAEDRVGGSPNAEAGGAAVPPETRANPGVGNGAGDDEDRNGALDAHAFFPNEEAEA